MPTQSFRQTLKDAATANPAFADHLLEDAVNALLAGEVDEGRTLLRAHVNATIGFEDLGELTGKSPKSLMRMLGADGNPTAINLLGMITQMSRASGVTIEAHVRRSAGAVS